MSAPRPVTGPHPATGEPTTWASGVDAAAAWGVTRACIRHWLMVGRRGWSYPDGRQPKRELGRKNCHVCGKQFMQRLDERDDAFRERKTGSKACERELIAAAKRGRTWSTKADAGGLPVETLWRNDVDPSNPRLWT